MANKHQRKGVFDNEPKNPEFDHLVHWFKVESWMATIEKNSKTFVVYLKGSAVGYFTVLYASFALPMVKYPSAQKAQVLLLGRMYISNAYRSCGIGGVIIKFVTGMAIQADSLIACRGVYVEANPNERTIGFYKKSGFETLEQDSRNVSMWLKLDVVDVKAS